MVSLQDERYENLFAREILPKILLDYADGRYQTRDDFLFFTSYKYSEFFRIHVKDFGIMLKLGPPSSWPKLANKMFSIVEETGAYFEDGNGQTQPITLNKNDAFMLRDIRFHFEKDMARDSITVDLKFIIGLPDTTLNSTLRANFAYTNIVPHLAFESEEIERMEREAKPGLEDRYEDAGAWS